MSLRLPNFAGFRVVFRACVLLVLGGVLQLSTFAPTALAAELASYNFRISSDKRILQHPNNPNVRLMTARATRYDEIVGRMMPYFELTNTSANDDLVSWDITLGNSAVQFTHVATLSSNQGVVVSQGDSASTHLAMQFAGLKPGETFIGRLRLQATNPVNGSSLVDYRQSLFEINGASTENNATIRAEFASGSIIVGQLPNFTSLEGRLTPNSWGLCNGCTSGCNEIFELQQIETVPVPEPATMLLGGIGFVCVLVQAIRRQRK